MQESPCPVLHIYTSRFLCGSVVLHQYFVSPQAPELPTGDPEWPKRGNHWATVRTGRSHRGSPELIGGMEVSLCHSDFVDLAGMLC